MQEQRVLEKVHFKLPSDWSREDFLELSEEACRLLQSCEGFEGRKLLFSADNGEWTDLVWWSTLGHAQAAMDALSKNPALDAMFTRLLDVSIQHAAHLSALDVMRSVTSFGTRSGDRPVYEVLTYRLNDGVSPSSYEEVLRILGQVVQNYDGFLSRNVYLEKGSGTWVELLVYRNPDAAREMAGPFMAEPAMQPVMAMIDKNSVEMVFGQELMSRTHA